MLPSSSWIFYNSIFTTNPIFIFIFALYILHFIFLFSKIPNDLIEKKMIQWKLVRKENEANIQIVVFIPSL